MINDIFFVGGTSLFTPFAWEGFIFDHHAICLLIISAKPGSLAKGLISEREYMSHISRLITTRLAVYDAKESQVFLT